MTSPLLWYLNRGSGIVLVVVFTVTVVIGVLATGRAVSPWWPRFITQGLHRGLSAVAVLMLLVHAVVAVVDEFVDIRWWQTVVPVGSAYEPFWLGLGTLSLDLTVVVVATSLARTRLPHRLWFLVHLTTYAAWALGVVHGLGIGTDADLGWSRLITVVCVALVVLAALARVTAVLLGRRRRGSSGPPVPGRADRDLLAGGGAR
ncbi:ferric reductase-like transmembrane domain-containing protein [Phycicoccus sonneratiae]|uniref:Ferric reductase-like transmembrane domain-containing protein n=1 Tax=Phycicoccus sonneratiae TaxID=2807628 RepID=A0ABS2CK94_9MICO|nr:ferric reductase-like transmembrane domain-containing protein [Phycicoccus sonneraticus]MBM6400312.1 ferric reductase-like transmembrane domain-containing protein [Phycicoccus sonneraticus]